MSVPVQAHANEPNFPPSEVRMSWSRTSMMLRCVLPTLLLATACSDSSSGPGVGDGLTPGFLPLVALFGQGMGEIKATRVPHPTTAGNFAVHIEVKVRGAKANTGFQVQRAAEGFGAAPPAGFDIATLTDGSCQRGLAMAPWSAITPAPVYFSSFVDQGTGSPILTTNASGEGQADFGQALTFPLPAFDVVFRLVEVGAAPKAVLQSSCTTLPL
ncbi:MAG TPA: hypothetical protein VH762_03000 [Gemmatimonadaceae bacterium]|jgi:hypothetical protein